MTAIEIKKERERKRISGLVELQMNRTGADLQTACRSLLEGSNDKAFKRHVQSIEKEGLSKFLYQSV